MAAPDGIISVELRLLMEAALKQSREAAAAMAKEFSKVGMTYQPAKMATETEKAATAQDKLTRAVKDTNKALTEQQARAQRLKDIASGKLSPVMPGQTVTIAGSNASNKVYGPGAIIPGGIGAPNTATAASALNQPGKPGIPNPLNNMLRRQMLLQPGLPNVPFPALPNAPKPQPLPPSMFKQLAPMLAAAIGTGIGGPLGGAIAGVLTKANPAVAAVTAAMTALRFATMQTAQAFDNARSIYAKSIQSGFGTGMQVQRGMLASIIGVSESDIFQFGAQIQYLNGQIEFARKTLTDTTVPLTQVAWGFKIVGENIKALWAQIASGLAPALNAITDDFNSFLTVLGKSDILKGVAEVLGAVLIAFNDAIGVFEVAVNAFTTGFKIIADVISIFIMDTMNLLSHIPGLKKMGGWDTSKASADIVNQSTNLANQAKTVWDNKFGKSGGIPQPTAYMKQMPASSWEKLGLQVGAGGGGNFNQQTANHTKKITGQMEKLIQAVVGNKMNSTKPAGLPSGA